MEELKELNILDSLFFLMEHEDKDIKNTILWVSIIIFFFCF